MVDNVIVGANSYIARSFIYKLVSSYNCDSYKLYGKDEYQIDGFNNYEIVNILDRNDVKKLDLDCKYIYMFVGKTGSADGFENYIDSIMINQVSLLNLLDQYVKQRSKAKIVFLSTRLIYNNYKGLQKENFKSNLKSIYSVNKYACEQYLKIYSNVFGVKYVILRLCIPYGTLINGAMSYGTCGFMLNRAIKGEDITLYGDGSQRRTFTYIGDVADILYNVALDESCVDDIYNIGGEDFSLCEAALMIAKKYGVNIKNVHFPEIESKIESGDTVFDSQKLDSIIGNFHRTKFEDWINNL